jgi:hypothetical protein
MADNSPENTKKIAFIQNGVIMQILDTDEAFSALLLGNFDKIDISNIENAADAVPNDLYDESTRTITLVREEG